MCSFHTLVKQSHCRCLNDLHNFSHVLTAVQPFCQLASISNGNGSFFGNVKTDLNGQQESMFLD